LIVKVVFSDIPKQFKNHQSVLKDSTALCHSSVTHFQGMNKRVFEKSLPSEATLAGRETSNE